MRSAATSLLACAFVVLAATLCWPARADIVIAVAAQMTGKVAWSGMQLQRGAELAATAINSAGGVLGQQLRLITADDFCDPDQAVVAARKLVADGAVVVIGHGCSGASIPASAVYESAGVVQISASSTNPLLTEQGRGNVFRVVGRDDQQGIAAGNYLADRWGDKKIAILSDDSTYGKGLADETRKQLNRRGITEAVDRSYAPGGENYAAEIAALQAASIAVAYVGGYYTETALMARAARDRGYEIQLVSGDTLATEEFALIAGPAAEGTLFTFGPDPRRNAEAAAVVERFHAENFEPDGFTLFSYAAVQAWAQAVGKAGSLDTQAVIASLHGGRFDTVLGPISFDRKGDVTVQSWIWYVWRGGDYVPMK
jgi:branched-chain amino acid transport system substrate-binding protein